jgi:hypothetical protein
MGSNPQIVLVQQYQSDGSFWALLNNGSWYQISSIPLKPLPVSSTYPWVTNPNTGSNEPGGQP